MAKYVYDVKSENFKRTDNRGKPLNVNITEANRIINLIDLGHSIADINGKVALSNPKGTATTINSFIRNYRDGNIEIPADAPAPVHVFDSLTESDRMDALEERIKNLEDEIAELKKGKVRKWLKF